jgi:methionine-rich copper-binding protein CopC
MAPAIALSMIISAIGVALTWSTISAHANLDHSEPAEDARLAQAPQTLSLYFTQRLNPSGSWINLEDSAGKVTPLAAQVDSADTKVMRAPLPRLVPSAYTVRWQSLSADDDDYADGSFRFVVLNPDGSDPDATADGSSSDSGDSGGAGLVMIGLGVALLVAVVAGIAFLTRLKGRRAG